MMREGRGRIARGCDVCSCAGTGMRVVEVWIGGEGGGWKTDCEQRAS